MYPVYSFYPSQLCAVLFTSSLHPIWLSSSVDPNLQRGCLEALHCLSLHYPPPSLPHLWGCVQSTCTLLAILQELLNCSRLAWGIQGTHSCHVPFLVSNPRSAAETWLQSDTASSWNVEVGKHGLWDRRVNFLHINQWHHFSIMVSLPLAIRICTVGLIYGINTNLTHVMCLSSMSVCK